MITSPVLQYIRPDTLPLPAPLGHHHLPLRPPVVGVHLPPDRLEVQPSRPARLQVAAPGDGAPLLLPPGHLLPQPHQAGAQADRGYPHVDLAGGDDTLQYNEQVR